METIAEGMIRLVNSGHLAITRPVTPKLRGRKPYGGLEIRESHLREYLSIPKEKRSPADFARKITDEYKNKRGKQYSPQHFRNALTEQSEKLMLKELPQGACYE